MRPVEGTILTVVRAIAEAVEALDGAVARRAARARRTRPRATRSRARPICCRCCARPASSTRAARASRCCSTRCSKWSTAGRSPSPSSSTTPAAVAAHLAGRRRVGPALRGHVPPRRARRRRSPAFREAWAAIGDSIVVVGGDGIWNCHVHTNDIGAAVEAGIDAGRPALDPRHRPDRAGRRGAVGARGRGRRRPRRGAAVETAPSPPRSSRSASATACAACSRASACSSVVAGGQSMNPSTAQILEAVEACAADCVIVLPEQQEHRAGRAARSTRSPRSTSRSCATTSVPEALAALVEYDPNAELAENEATMTSARERVRTGEVTQAVRDTRRSTSAQIREGDWIALSRDGIVATTRVAGRRGVRAARQARRRRQRDRHGARRLPTRAAKDTERIREHIEVDVPAPRGRVPRRRPAALPVPRRRGVARHAVPAGDPPLTLRGPARDRPGAAEGRRPRARGAARRHGPAHRARPAAALPAPLDRPHEARRHRRARGRRGGDGVRRGALGPRPPHAQRPGARRGRDPRRHVAAQRHVLQPGVAREAARGRHRGVALRQARRVPRQAPDDEPGRRRARPGRRRRRQDRRDRARLPAVGQGRGVHLAAAHAGVGEALREVRARAASPTRSTRRCSTATTSSTATLAMRAIHRPDSMAEHARGREAPDVRRVPAHAGRASSRASARSRPRSRGSATTVDGPLVDAFLAQLPFALTGDQQRAIAEITHDMAGAAPMHRLLQGDVGSGKTVVALAALLVAVQGGYQGAFMAPTEVLAEQHYLGSVKMLEGLTVRRRGLAARRPAGARRAAHQPHDRGRAPAHRDGPRRQRGRHPRRHARVALRRRRVHQARPRGDRRAAPLRRRAARAPQGEGRRPTSCPTCS